VLRGDVEKLAADIRVLRPLRFASEPRRCLAIFLGSRSAHDEH